MGVTAKKYRVLVKKITNLCFSVLSQNLEKLKPIKTYIHDHYL
jgi:hypothetical protein